MTTIHKSRRRAYINLVFTTNAKDKLGLLTMRWINFPTSLYLCGLRRAQSTLPLISNLYP